MKQCKEWLNENRFIILGFLIPFFVWIFLCIIMCITPFGPYSLLISDLEAGHIDALTKLRDIVLEGKSLAYCWGQIQGSTPFAGLGLGTLISTFNFIIFFCGKRSNFISINLDYYFEDWMLWCNLCILFEKDF